MSAWLDAIRGLSFGLWVNACFKAASNELLCISSNYEKLSTWLLMMAGRS